MSDASGPSAVFGKVKAYCRRNDDPEKRGRIICYCPQVMGLKDDEKHWLGWAEACLPWVGGLNTLDSGPPRTKLQNGGVEVGIWLEFEGGHLGNFDHPIWVGTFLPAPTPTSENAQMSLDDAEGITGGSLLDNPPAGSDVAAIFPPKPLPAEPEARLMAKEGRDIVIGSDKGGFIVIGPSGIHLTGVQITLNGKLMDAATSDGVVG